MAASAIVYYIWFSNAVEGSLADSSLTSRGLKMNQKANEGINQRRRREQVGMGRGGGGMGGGGHLSVVAVSVLIVPFFV